jgi:hypothetical protein
MTSFHLVSRCRLERHGRIDFPNRLTSHTRPVAHDTSTSDTDTDTASVSGWAYRREGRADVLNMSIYRSCRGSLPQHSGSAFEDVPGRAMSWSYPTCSSVNCLSVSRSSDGPYEVSLATTTLFALPTQNNDRIRAQLLTTRLEALTT